MGTLNLDPLELDKLSFALTPRGGFLLLRIEFPAGTPDEQVTKIAQVLNTVSHRHTPLSDLREKDMELNTQLTTRYKFTKDKSRSQGFPVIAVEASEGEESGFRADSANSAVGKRMSELHKDCTSVLKMAAQELRDQKRKQGQQDGKVTWYSCVYEAQEAIVLPVRDMDAETYARLREDVSYTLGSKAAPSMRWVESKTVGCYAFIVKGAENITALIKAKLVPENTPQVFFCNKHRDELTALLQRRGTTAAGQNAIGLSDSDVRLAAEKRDNPKQ